MGIVYVTADIALHNSYHDTHLAIFMEQRAQLETMRRALNEGADPNAVYENSPSMLDFAAPLINTLNNEEAVALVDLLLARGANPLKGGRPALSYLSEASLQSENVWRHLFQRMIDEDAEQWKADDGGNLLHVLVRHAPEVVNGQIRQAKKYRPNAETALARLANQHDERGRTPCHRLWDDASRLMDSYQIARACEGMSDEDETAKQWLQMTHHTWGAQTSLCHLGAGLAAADSQGVSAMDLIIMRVENTQTMLFPKRYSICQQVASEIERRALDQQTPEAPHGEARKAGPRL